MKQMSFSRRVSLAAVVASLVAVVALVSGCSDNDNARNFSFNKYRPFHVVQFSGGKQIGEWDTNSRPNSEVHSDGFTFVDSKTGKLWLVSGDVQIIEK